MSVIVPYFKPEMRKGALVNLGLPQNSFQTKLIQITDCSDEKKTNERLISIHYNPIELDRIIEDGSYNSNFVVSLANIRGIIIDLETNKVILKSFPKTVNIPINSVPLDNLLPIYLNGLPNIPSKGIYKKCYGGSLLRIYCHDGKARSSTHRKLDATNSFFGDSDKFSEIWLKDQNVFPSYNSLYENCTSDIIHLFIINNRKLIVDSRENQDYDRVVYLKSYSMTDHTKNCDITDFIMKRNKTVSKPIEICQIYSPEEVNIVLQGEPVIIKKNESHSQLFNNALFSNFSGGEKVIYENDFGIFTLTPSSCAFRQRINDGKVNISKLFTDGIADYDRNSKGFIKVGFSLESLKEISNLLGESMPVNLENYIPIEGQANLCVLLNLIYTVPISRLPECFIAYEEFNDKIKEAIELLINRKTELQSSIYNNNFENYAGIKSMGTSFKKYLSESMINLSDKIDGPRSNWSDSAREMFNIYYMLKCNTSEENLISLETINDNLGIISLVSNASGDDLYSFTTYKKKIEKEAEAMRKRVESGKV